MKPVTAGPHFQWVMKEEGLGGSHNPDSVEDGAPGGRISNHVVICSVAQ